MLSHDFDKYVVYAKGNNSKTQFIGVVTSNSDFHAECPEELIPPNLIKILVSIEDKRYKNHNGIDYFAIARAVYVNLSHWRILQGGSTISQQYARYLLKDYRRSLLRKFKETLLALKLEKLYTKKEIINSYINNVFWGRQYYGIRSVSLCLFNKEPWNLSNYEMIVLISLLKGPNLYLSNPQRLDKRISAVCNTLEKNRTLNKKKVPLKTLPQIFEITPLRIHPNAIQYIIKSINSKTKTIVSSLDYNLQKELTLYFGKVRRNISVLVMKDGFVKAGFSKFGLDYPFDFKSNVGSTLKPFIFCFLLSKGVNPYQLFSTEFNTNSNWIVREAISPSSKFMTLHDALLYSNNNVFLNACYENNINEVLLFLSNTLSIDVKNLTPSTILGASNCGLSLYQLTKAYYLFFKPELLDSNKKICLAILNKISKIKLNNSYLFLKTGTTNRNKEMYAMIRDKRNVLYSFLWHDDYSIITSKDGHFINTIRDFLYYLATKQFSYLY